MSSNMECPPHRYVSSSDLVRYAQRRSLRPYVLASALTAKPRAAKSLWHKKSPSRSSTGSCPSRASQHSPRATTPSFTCGNGSKRTAQEPAAWIPTRKASATLWRASATQPAHWTCWSTMRASRSGEGEGLPSTVRLEAIQTLDVNYYGALRVTQAFLPLVQKAQARRIVNVSSTPVTVNSVCSGVQRHRYEQQPRNAAPLGGSEGRRARRHAPDGRSQRQLLRRERCRGLVTSRTSARDNQGRVGPDWAG